MGLFGIGKPKDEALEQKIEKLDSKISEKKQLLDETLTSIKNAKQELGLIDDAMSLEKKLNDLKVEVDNANNELSIANESLGLQEYGFFERQYKFSDSIQYSNSLKDIRNQAKDMVKNGTAITILGELTYNNSVPKGRAIQNKISKAAIRGFNGESDAILTKISVSNLDKKIQALIRSYEQLNKMYSSNLLAISSSYAELKIEELKLAAEYELVKQEEKELLREQREQEREDKKVQAEIIAAKKKLEKDRTHYKQVLADLYEKLKVSSEDDAATIKLNISEYETKINEIQQDIEDVDYREGQATAGYVYIISNIGAFGPDVFKIGVTRRLEPLERINELGSASVPFKFDVHALIFSEDAFALETTLHQKFDKQKINKVNGRKEFFKIQLEDIKDVLADYPGISVDFNDNVESFEYQQSLLFEKNI